MPSGGASAFRALIVSCLVLAWLVAKMSVVVGRPPRSAGSAGRSGTSAWAGACRSFRRMLTQLLIGGWLRELFTLGVTADLYAGVPALYVNFVDYDVAAHELGPRHPEALRALRGIDRSIARFARVLRRIPEHRYDLFVLSDHGQIHSVPFHAVAGGVGVAEAIVGCFGPERGPRPAPEPPATRRGVSSRDGPGPRRRASRCPSGRSPGGGSGSSPCTERPVRERNAVWIGGLCIVPAGPNVNVYLTHTTRRVLAEEIEARLPGRARPAVAPPRHRLRPRPGCSRTRVLLSGRGVPDPAPPGYHGLSRLRPTRSRRRRAGLAGPPRACRRAETSSCTDTTRRPAA